VSSCLMPDTAVGRVRDSGEKCLRALPFRGQYSAPVLQIGEYDEGHGSPLDRIVLSTNDRRP
jgi:hypothetical protein